MRDWSGTWYATRTTWRKRRSRCSLAALCVAPSFSRLWLIVSVASLSTSSASSRCSFLESSSHSCQTTSPTPCFAFSSEPCARCVTTDFCSSCVQRRLSTLAVNTGRQLGLCLQVVSTGVHDHGPRVLSFGDSREWMALSDQFLSRIEPRLRVLSSDSTCPHKYKWSKWILTKDRISVADFSRGQCMWH